MRDKKEQTNERPPLFALFLIILKVSFHLILILANIFRNPKNSYLCSMRIQVLHTKRNETLQFN